jgi:hypothetical protein
VNISSQTGNLNVAIASSSVTLDVNISSQTANINVALAASSITLTTQGNVPITIGTDTYQSVPVSIVAQQIGNISIDIAAQTVGNLNVNLAAQSGNINVNFAAQSANINVALAASSATVTVAVSGTADVNISSQSANLNVAIAASSVTLDVNISSQSSNLNVNLSASAITLNVNITNASITVSGSVSISGVPAVTINAGSAVIGSINEIVSPVIARTTIALGYQEAVEYLNYSGSAFFMSGSNGDSSADYSLGAQNWTQTTIWTQSGTASSFYTCASRYAGLSAALTILGMQSYVSPSASGSYQFRIRGAIYSDNAGALGTLLAETIVASFSLTVDTTPIAAPVAAFFASPVALAASTAYWFAWTVYLDNTTAAGASLPSTKSTTSLATYSLGNSVITAISGFPSASSWTSQGSQDAPATIILSNAGTAISNPLSVSQVLASAVTYNGQLVIKVGVTTHGTNIVGITSFTYSIEDTTTGTYIADGVTVNGNNLGLGVASLSDSVAVSGFTVNSGDTLEISVTSITVYGGAIDGSLGSAQVYLDSLDGLSYIVFPLQ